MADQLTQAKLGGASAAGNVPPAAAQRAQQAAVANFCDNTIGDNATFNINVSNVMDEETMQRALSQLLDRIKASGAGDEASLEEKQAHVPLRITGFIGFT